MTQQQNQQTPQAPQLQPQPQPLQQQTQQQPQQMPQAPQPQQMQQQTQQLQPQQPTQSLISFSTTAPEPTSKPNAWDSIIAQQQEQINALMAQNQALTGQITQMVQGGAQFTQQPQQVQQVQQPQQMQQPTEFPPVYDGASPLAMFNPPALSDNRDYSLEGLASEIGKPADKN